MWRLTERIVRSTFVTAWFFADCPTSTSPFFEKATTDGVVREPSELAITVGSPPSKTDTTEFVVPKSIPTARPIICVSFRYICCARRIIRRTLSAFACGPARDLTRSIYVFV